MSEPETATHRARAADGSGTMFDGIAGRYDVLNRLMSLGIDQRWRRRAVKALALEPGMRVLDIATGTADLALLIARSETSLEVVGLDASQQMLTCARDKVQKAGLSQRIELVTGDAEGLPFAAQSFDAISIAFGIRNVRNRERALREMARVLRRRGRLAILELSEPARGLFAPFARFHIRTLVPALGAALSGAREYRYLERSIAAFPPADEFSELMRGAGLRVLSAEPLTLGVCYLYVAEPEDTA